MKNSEMVREFMRKFKQQVDVDIDQADLKSLVNMFELRERLIKEEFDELQAGMNNFILYTKDPDLADDAHESKVEILDALADLLYVVYGTAITFNMDIDEAMRRVHASNMTKLGSDGEPVYDESGKVIKGPDYQEPKLEDLV